VRMIKGAWKSGRERKETGPVRKGPITLIVGDANGASGQSRGGGKLDGEGRWLRDHQRVPKKTKAKIQCAG